MTKAEKLNICQSCEHVRRKDLIGKLGYIYCGANKCKCSLVGLTTSPRFKCPKEKF